MGKRTGATEEPPSPEKNTSGTTAKKVAAPNDTAQRHPARRSFLNVNGDVAVRVNLQVPADLSVPRDDGVRTNLLPTGRVNLETFKAR
jgi:hypothetical protein